MFKYQILPKILSVNGGGGAQDALRYYPPPFWLTMVQLSQSWGRWLLLPLKIGGASDCGLGLFSNRYLIGGDDTWLR